ncbi:MAG: carbohydrate ABC transporter permease, partial [Verrucomicrobia bacterium]|nr:carbohydrate ABC transporter permease [Verrucomicrobiota bacterium]
MRKTNPVAARPGGGDTVAYAILSLISIYCAIPFVWLMLASFDGNASLFLRWPGPWTLNNYIGIFVREGGARWFLNSFIVVGAATLIVLLFSGLGGYALSRTSAWWKRPFLYTIILVRVVPPPALVVPLYSILLTANNAVGSFVRSQVAPEWVRPAMLAVGLIDGYLGLILVFAAMQLPLALWIMKTYFDTIPPDYEEAALVDGATLFQRIRLVVAPLALPGLGAAGIFAFISAWGDSLMPLIFLSSSELQMLPLGLFRAFLRVQQIDYGFLSALAILYMLPAVIAFGFARRYFIQTFSG